MVEVLQPATEPIIERLVILLNQRCTSAATVRERVAELEESSYGRHMVIIETDKEREATEDKVRTTLREGDVLGIAGGDGTVNTAARAAGQIPILPLWGGNGNDLAHMLNGRAPRRPSSLLAEGKQIAIRPIQGIITSETGQSTEIAAAYAGFGAGALGAVKLNEPSHRQKLFYNSPVGRVAYEADLLLRAFAESPNIRITHEDEQRNLYDLTVANGPRIAKFGRLPVQLAEERHFVFEVENKGIIPVARRMGALAIGRPEGSYITDEPYEFTVHDPTIAHFDAETLGLMPETHVAISQRAEPFYAIATRI